MSSEYDIVTRLRLAGCCGPRVKPCARCVAEDIAADEIERLRAERSAIDALHQPIPNPYDGEPNSLCGHCLHQWPCETHRLLHPGAATRAR